MRIGLDLRWLQRAYLNSPEGALGGVGAVIAGLWRGLCEVAPDDRLIALLNRGPVPAPVAALIATAPQAEAHPIGVHGFCPPLDRRWKILNLANLAETYGGLGPALSSLRLDVLHMTDHVPPPLGLGCPSVATLHDYYAEVSRGWAIYRQLCRRMHRARCVVAVSEAVAAEYRAVPARASDVRVVHNGIDLAVFRPDGGAADRASLAIPGDYLLHAGVLSARKNPHGILEALARLRAQGPVPYLVSTGAYGTVPGMRERLVALAQAAGMADRLVVLDRGLDALGMAALYRGALGLVFPSLHEGFGLPAVESLACGTPCVVARVGGLSEVAGPLGIYVEPRDAGSIAVGIRRMLDDAAHRRRVAQEGPRWAQGFTYQAMARGYLAVYRALAAAR